MSPPTRSISVSWPRLSASIGSASATRRVRDLFLRGSQLVKNYKCKSAHCQIFLPICDIHSCNKKDERWFLGTVLASPYFWIENYKPYFETALLLVYIDLWHQIEKWLSL